VTECRVKYYPTEKENPYDWESGETWVSHEEGRRIKILMDPKEDCVMWVRHEEDKYGDVIVSDPGKPGRGTRVKAGENKVLKIFDEQLTLEIEHMKRNGNTV
jgi:hypothetical protein